ncbi:hypothetical protein [Brachybacterium sacelli]|uniref:hypothetical protein n=1 Tax=Brachybacterium sacelli TaxID=173364 RepID=UPI00361CE7CF
MRPSGGVGPQAGEGPSGCVGLISVFFTSGRPDITFSRPGVQLARHRAFGPVAPQVVVMYRVRRTGLGPGSR